MTVKTDQVIAHFANEIGQKKENFVEVINDLGQIVRLKVMLHAAHKELEGNLAIGEKGKSEGLEADLSRYLTTISKHALALLKLAARTADFCIVVMSQPAIEEVCNCVRLLSAIQKADPPISGAKEVLELAKKLPHLQSAVTFPDDKAEAPFSRFVVKK
jgi:hypothetical protein